VKRFLANQSKGMRIDHKEKKVYLSQVFKFDKKHFDAYAGGVLQFILPFVPADDQKMFQQGTYGLDYSYYDWNANDLKNATK
jgi:hypothetical protein